MLVGDANSRAKVGNGKKSQSCFRCYTSTNFGGDNAAPCADATLVIQASRSTITNNNSLDTEAFPTKACLGGIRSNILYPTWVDSYYVISVIMLKLQIVAGMERISTALIISPTLRILLLVLRHSPALALVRLAHRPIQSRFRRLC